MFVFETYWTTARGLEAMDNSNALLDLTVYGPQEPWEDSPTGWPQQWRKASTVPMDEVLCSDYGYTGSYRSVVRHLKMARIVANRRRAPGVPAPGSKRDRSVFTSTRAPRFTS